MSDIKIIDPHQGNSIIKEIKKAVREVLNEREDLEEDLHKLEIHSISNGQAKQLEIEQLKTQLKEAEGVIEFYGEGKLSTDATHVDNKVILGATARAYFKKWRGNE